MKKTIFFMMGLLFVAGCANNSNDAKLVTQSDDSNTIVVNKPKEQAMIKFEKASTLGRGDYIDVKKPVKVGPNHSQYERLKSKPVWVTVGRISKSQDGVYRYYEPETNELNPMYTDSDLKVLEDKIKSHLSNP